jgi:hypothetical protein
MPLVDNRPRARSTPPRYPVTASRPSPGRPVEPRRAALTAAVLSWAADPITTLSAPAARSWVPTMALSECWASTGNRERDVLAAVPGDGGLAAVGRARVLLGKAAARTVGGEHAVWPGRRLEVVELVARALDERRARVAEDGGVAPGEPGPIDRGLVAVVGLDVTLGGLADDRSGRGGNRRSGHVHRGSVSISTRGQGRLDARTGAAGS